jgi:hypothetical protein
MKYAQDIDMIELESGQDASTAGVGVGSIPARGSRSYNYRVVMRKGGDNKMKYLVTKSFPS